MRKKTDLENEAITKTKQAQASNKESEGGADIIPLTPFIEITEENPSNQRADEAIEPPLITKKDTAHFNKEFKCEPSVFYPYHNNSGVTVGYIARWDLKLESGGKKKEVRPYTYNFEKQRYESKYFGGGLDHSRPLYNLPELLAKPEATVMIVEGEKTVEAAKILFPEFVITASSGGANHAKKTDWQPLEGRDIIVSPDDGEAGTIYLAAVKKELKRVRAKINKILEPSKLSGHVVEGGRITKRQGEIPKGYDLADALADGWTPELIAIAQANTMFSPFFKDVAKPKVLRQELLEGEELIELESKTYKLTPYGLYLGYLAKATEEDLSVYPDHDYGVNDIALGIVKETWLPLCGYLKPIYQITDIDNSWGMLVKIKNIDNVEKDIFLKRTDWLGEKGAVEVLQDQGLRLRGLKKDKFDLINEYLNEFKPESKAIGVDMVGWQGENKAYLLPFVDKSRNCYIDQTALEGKIPTEYILQQKGAVTRVLKKKGTLEKWKRTVGEVTRGNNLHTFAILASLAAPALKPLGEEGGFIHYAGSTSIGKSTVLHVAKSVWGFENLGSFRTTDNALESTCKNSNDGVLFLDEIDQIESDDLHKVIYMLANGVTKGRSDRGGNAKSTTHFTVLAQSTGETGLVAKLAEKKIRAKGGQLIRMLELDADQGKGLNTFDVLNINPDTGERFANGKEQAEYLKTNAKENCGVVIDALLKKVVPEAKDYKESLEKEKAIWIQRKVKDIKTPEVERAAKKFATIYANGVIAAEFEIIPHSIEEVEACIDAMFRNWLNRYGGDVSYEFRLMLGDLRTLTIEQQHLRFYDASIPIAEQKTLIRDKAGYFKKGEVEGDDEVWYDPEVFKKEILKGRDEKVFFPMLAEKSYLKKDKDGRLIQMKRPKGETSRRFIVISVAALLGEDD
jgi:putative DNA primase/helicase